MTKLKSLGCDLNSGATKNRERLKIEEIRYIIRKRNHMNVTNVENLLDGRFKNKSNVPNIHNMIKYLLNTYLNTTCDTYII